MTLEELLCQIKSKFKSVSGELEPYREIPEVESFLIRRSDDFKEFEKAVRSYPLTELTGVVLNSLRERGFSYKIYGICRIGPEYFVVTKKVRKAIKEYEEELLRQAREEEKKQEKLNFNSEYAIPDELTPEQLEEMFGE